jgi:RimJ/RimL family protein N-acetyltransferase
LIWRRSEQEESGSYQIRIARPSDAKGIIECMQSVMDERIYLVSEYYLWSERGEQERIRSPEDLTLVCDLDRKIVGVLTLQRGMYKKNRHTAQLGIALMNGHRHKGLGSRMISSAIEWARSKGIKKINLEVFSSNLSAIETYRKNGFEVEGVKKKQFLIDEIYVDDVIMSIWLE